VNSNASLPGVVGTVGLTNDPLRGHIVTVDGKAAVREKKDYLLPGASGEPVRAQLDGRFLAEHPVLVIGDREFPTGPATPPFLHVISFLPALFVFTGTPFVGALLAVLGVLFNLWIVRAPRTEAWKSVVILTVFVVAVVLLTAWAFFYGWVLGLFGR